MCCPVTAFCIVLLGMFSNADAILNAEPVPPDTFKFHASVWYYGGNFNGYKCGGAVLDELHILTAGHCVARSQSPLLYTVTIGGKSADGSVSPLELRVKYIYMHRDYRHHGDGQNRIMHDIAVLTLVTPLTLGGQIDRVHLPQHSARECQAKCVVVNWAHTPENTIEVWGTLHYMTVNIVTPAQRQDYADIAFPRTQPHDDEYFVIDTSRKATTEKGDSGSPVACAEGGLWIINGVLSASIKSPPLWTIVVDTSVHLDFIRSAMKDEVTEIMNRYADDLCPMLDDDLLPDFSVLIPDIADPEPEPQPGPSGVKRKSDDDSSQPVVKQSKPGFK